MKHLQKIEHIGIAIRDLQKGNTLYSKILGVPAYKEEEVTSEHVKTSFFKVGESKIELLASTHETSAIAKFLEKRGEGIHHIAFAVDHLESEISRLKAEGFTFVSETPKLGADNKRVAFVHPKDCSGVLIELCEEINESVQK